MAVPGPDGSTTYVDPASLLAFRLPSDAPGDRVVLAAELAARAAALPPDDPAREVLAAAAGVLLVPAHGSTTAPLPSYRAAVTGSTALRRPPDLPNATWAFDTLPRASRPIPLLPVTCRPALRPASRHLRDDAHTRQRLVNADRRRATQAE